MIRIKTPFWLGLVAILILTVPYLYAYQRGGVDWSFGGFLLNPVDGQSYLAKMQQGYQGDWKFTLPYTAEPGSGAYLFLYYIFLGHLARITQMPLGFIFHGARLVGSGLLLIAIWKFAEQLFSERKYQYFFYTIAALGSGMGWIAIFFGMFTSDFWVAEAYPFLSMYANPHFPLGLGLLILEISPSNSNIYRSFVRGLLLGMIQPFGIIIVILVKISQAVQEAWSAKTFNPGGLVKIKSVQSLIGLGLGGGGVLLYQFLSILSDPVLRIWNAQNITPSPGFLDLIVSLSPGILIAILGIKASWRSNKGRVLVIWAIIGIVLMFIPWNLNRRFLTGIYVPLAGLSVYGIQYLVDQGRIPFRKMVLVCLFLVLPTNLIVLSSGIQAANNRDPAIYHATELDDVFYWISQHTAADTLILGDEEAGLLIPATTGRRVIYGHPFETIHSQDERSLINSIYGGRLSSRDIFEILAKREVDYILVQNKYGNLFSVQDPPKFWKNIYSNPGASLYQVLYP